MLLLILCCFVSIPTLSASPDSGTFHRHILNSDGSNANAIRIIVIHRNLETTEDPVISVGMTDSEGIFSRTFTIPDHWKRVQVSTIAIAEGDWVGFTGRYSERGEILEDTLEVTVSKSRTLKIRIHKADGTPISGIRMAVSKIAEPQKEGNYPFSQPIPKLPDGIWSGVSDADGLCEISDVPAGCRFYLTHEDASLSQALGQREIFISNKTPISDGDEYEITLLAPGSISGRVLLPTGEPARNAEFVFLEPSGIAMTTAYLSAVWTDDSGRFHAPSVPPSTYQPRIDLITPLNSEWIAEALPTVEVSDRTPTVMPDIILVKVAVVTAEIVDAETEEKIEEPIIFRLPPGRHELSYRSKSMTPDGYLDGNYIVPVTVEAGDRKQIVFKLNPVKKDQLISGTVYDADGKPAVDVSVVLTGSGTWGISKRVKTDLEGKFEIIQPYNLRRVSVLASNGINAVSEIIPAKPGDEVQLTLKPAGFGRIQGTVQDISGNPICKAEVRLFHPTLREGRDFYAVFGTILPERTLSDETGKYAFDTVWVGFQGYGLSASAEGYGSASSKLLNVSDGQSLEVGLVLESAAEKLSGIVVDAKGDPVARAWVSCSGDGQPGGFDQVVSDADGHFLIEPLKPGNVYLQAGKFDSESSREISARVTVPCDPVRLVLPAADGVVGGKVLDPEGNPVADVEVSASMRNRKTVTDKKGNFRITGLMSGWLDIKTSKGTKGQERMVAEQRAKPGMVDIVLRLEPEAPESEPLPQEPLNLIGQPAPDIHVETWFNSPPHPAKAGGKVRILDFWGLECAPCIATMPKIAKFWKNAPQESLEIIALTGHYHDEEIREFLETHPDYAFSFAKHSPQSTAYRDYDIRYNPTYVVISKMGIILSYGSDWGKAAAVALKALEE